MKRVDPYFSSWRMRALRGRDGKMGSECILSHFEEQHVNQDVARFAVKCGMWGVVKNMDGGFRKFQRERRARATASAAGLGYPAAQQIDRVRRRRKSRRKGEILRRLAMGAAVSASVGVPRGDGRESSRGRLCP